MIIKRKYATYSQLKDDPASYSAIIETMVNAGLSKDEAESRLSRAEDVLVCNTNIETGFPRESFPVFMEKLEELDRTQPYDNGYSYRDVDRVMCFPNREGNGMMQILFFDNNEYHNRIVQIIAFECDGNSIAPVDPWDVGTIILG